MIGCGTVGGGVARLLSEQADLYIDRLGVPIELVRVLVRDISKPKQDVVSKDLLTDDVDSFFDTPDMSIVIEVAGGIDPMGDYVRRALTNGKHVVTANKSLLADQGSDLFKLAHENDTAIAFEASCGGGIPLITALQFGLMANQIDAMYGILNGTCNYILTEMTRGGKSYADALAEAQAQGFAEADPALDVSARDAAQKLCILASLAFGVRVKEPNVTVEGIDNLKLDDIRFGKELGYDVKLLAIAERQTDEGGSLSLRVHPCFVHQERMIAQVLGPFNALSVYGHAVGQTMYVGRGAGRMPTASAVVSDLLNVASGWYVQAFKQLNLWCDRHEPPQLINPDDLMSRFYIRVRALDGPGVMAKVTRALGDHGIGLSAVIQHEYDAGQFVPLAITTHDARQGSLFAALDEIEKLSVIEGRPVCIRIVEMPTG